MHKRFLQISLIGLILIVGAAACGPFAGTTAPTSQPPAVNTPVATSANTPAGVSVGIAQPTPAPTDTSAPTPTPTSAAISAVSPTPSGPAVAQTRPIKNVSSGLDKLKSYRARAGYKFDGKDKTGKPATGSLDFAQEIDNVNQNQHMKIAFSGKPLDASSSGTAATPGSYETYNIGGNQFVINGGKCQYFGSGISTTARALFSPDAFISTDKATLVGRAELVNGVISDHYTFTEAALASNVLTGLKLVQGDAWVAWDGYVVKVTAQATGKTTGGSEGTINYKYDVDSVNSLPSIVQPADCVVPVAVLDVPVPPNATEKKVIEAVDQTITTFKSPDPIKTVADFYRQSMPGQGWQAAGDKSSGATSIVLTYTKDAGKRTLMVNVIALGAVTNVFITDKKSP